MAGHNLAEIHVSQIAIVVDNCIETVQIAKLPDGLKLFFVKRIANQIALHGERSFHETRGMEGPGGFGVSEARLADLASPGRPSPKSRFHQTRSVPSFR